MTDCSARTDEHADCKRQDLCKVYSWNLNRNLVYHAYYSARADQEHCALQTHAFMCSANSERECPVFESLSGLKPVRCTHIYTEELHEFSRVLYQDAEYVGRVTLRYPSDSER